MGFWFGFWLFIHILSTIAAFGPTLSFPLIGSMGAGAGQSLFATSVTEAISVKHATTIGAVTFISGVVLIFVAPAAQPSEPWLIAVVKKIQMGGIYLTATLLVILGLMVWKPGR